ncbi:MAG: DUF3168 domain-containing protein [Rhizobiaceae bacterium]
MMDASYELQIAIVGALKSDSVVRALVGGRIYDDVPRDASGKVTAHFPYISFGPEQTLPDGYDCQDGSEITIQIDAWSRAVGFPEVKKIAAAVRKVLHDADLPINENALVSMEFENRRVLRDPDGKTSHAVIIFRAVVEHD